MSLPGNALLTIYKSFVRPHLCHGDILYDEQINEKVTDAIQGTWRAKLYDELRLHLLIKSRWCNKFIFNNKIVPLDFSSQINYPLSISL